jgi:hypothetical protein
MEGSKLKKGQLGDYQTPPELVDQVLRVLHRSGFHWQRALEPTCGKGNFIAGLLSSPNPPEEIIGIELQETYWKQASAQFQPLDRHVSILKNNIFTISLKDELRWNHSGPLLILGNPPWVTNSEISGLDGDNLPQKKNIKGRRGIEAITGSSNFDLAESIIIRLMQEYRHEKPIFAFLCKTAVARNVLHYAYETGIGISKAEIRMIDAMKWFSAAVDACLFVFVPDQQSSERFASVYSDLDSRDPEHKIGYVHGKLVSNLERYCDVAFLEGQSPAEWRQGIKHDAASVMELIQTPEGWKNGLNEIVDVEDDYIYPLLKSSDIRQYLTNTSIKRAVLVPQKEAYEDTICLRDDAPLLWEYLQGHIERFDSRKSSIYKNKSSFAIFGLGKYSFAPYKIMVSGLYKTPTFIAVGPYYDKPVFCDDTCYLLACRSALQAAVIAVLLNHPLAKQFLESIAFFDSKRPITKTILKRLAYDRMLNCIPDDELHRQVSMTLHKLSGCDEYVPSMLENFSFSSASEHQDHQLLFK